MVSTDWVVITASVLSASAAVLLTVLVLVLASSVRRLERSVARMENETLPLVSEARRTLGHASGELARVEAVLEDTGSVTSTVASASHLAHRAFANPVVKVLAFGTGASTGLRQYREQRAARSKRNGKGRR
jgi:hypothetical protein